MTWRNHHSKSTSRRIHRSPKTWSRASKEAFIASRLPVDESGLYSAQNIQNRIGSKDHTVERLVWGYVPGQPLPMNAYNDITGLPEDKGYFGIHYGDVAGWLPILISDYNRSFEDALVVEIDTDGMVMLPDPNPMSSEYISSSGSTTSMPDSGVLVWKHREIPASKIVRVSKPDPAWIETFEEEESEGEGY